MADLSFLPDDFDFDDSNSFLDRIRLLLRSPSKPPMTRPRVRTPTDDRSFTPYIPLANRHERSRPRHDISRPSSISSSSSSTDPSFPTTPLTHVFPTTPACAADQADDPLQSDIHIIRHSLSLPWINAKVQHNDVVEKSEWDPLDAIPDSPTLPPSLALPEPEPLPLLTTATATSTPTPTPKKLVPMPSRPAPTLYIPPAPTYPPLTPGPSESSSTSISLSDCESGWEGETMVGDSETSTVTEVEVDPPAAPDWTLYLSRPHPRSRCTSANLAPSSRPNSPSCMDWTLELPVSRPPTPVPPVPSIPGALVMSTTTTAAAATAPATPVSQSARTSQCPSSWLSPPHTSNIPSSLRKAKSTHSLLPLPRTLTRAHMQTHFYRAS